MSDEIDDPPMSAQDVGAALVGFALSFTAVITSGKHNSGNDILSALASELHNMVEGMQERGDKGTPALKALTFAGIMLQASDPDDAAMLEASALKTDRS